MTYFNMAGLLGAVILILAFVGLFQRWNVRYGWHRRLCELVGKQAGDWILRIGFVAVVALVAGVLQRVGVVLPPEIEQFLPSQMTAIITAILSAGTYWIRSTRDAPKGGDGATG